MHRFKWYYTLIIIFLLVLITTSISCSELDLPENLAPESTERVARTPSTPTEGLPEIIEFYANPDEVMANEDAVLHWNVSGASSLTIDPDIGDVALSGRKNVRPRVYTTYILTAFNE